MCHVTVLSPHPDDAVFSLGLSLAAWSERGIKVRVINFFTVSGFAPRCGSKDTGVISAVREREDRKALGSISANIEIKSLGLLDAPLRLGLPVGSVFTLEVEMGEVRALQQRMAGPVIAPLGLGNHIDHLTVRAAAIRQEHKNLAFYEDLPYAAWSSDAAVRQCVREVEEMARARLRPVILRRAHAIATKRRIVARYRSQIDREDAELIARFAANYGGGERIWIPTPASRQMAILSQSR
jgi:LmbE family N-acetylglucosaminyl deacetylase